MLVNEIFSSLQGEGTWIGQPTIFIRLAGCNLRCQWCDTAYALEKDSGEEMSLDEILDRVWELDGALLGHVCITGGEPLVQDDVHSLITTLLNRSMHVVLETNGSLSVEEVACDDNMCISMDVKTPSSKMHEKCDHSMIDELGPADQLKFVISDEKDYNYALKILDEHTPACIVIFTAVGGKDIKWLAEKVLEDKLAVRVLPQLHKLVWGEEKGR